MHMQSWLHCERRREELRAKFVDYYITSHAIILMYAKIVAKVNATCEVGVKCLVPESICVDVAGNTKCKCRDNYIASENKCLPGKHIFFETLCDLIKIFCSCSLYY
jgi:hypothetical protein